MAEKRTFREFNNSIPYIVLAGIMLITCFHHILVAKFNSFSINIIEAILCSLLLIKGNIIRVRRKFAVIYIAFGILTLLCYFFVFRDLHYDRLLVIKNIINVSLEMYCFFLLWDVFGDKKIDYISSKILTVTISIQGLFYIAYKMPNGFITTFLESFLGNRIIRDREGRFQGSLSEPSYMGFWIGITIFLVILYLKRKIKYPIVAGLFFILFFECKAKFALMAFPVATVAAIYINKKERADLNKKTQVLLSIGLWGVMVILSYVYVSHFFNIIGEYFGKTITYATRFFFPFSAFRESVYFPLGTGFGLNYEYFRRSCEDLFPIIRSSGMDISEIYNYAYVSGNEAFFSSKETVSRILCAFGVIGFCYYIYFFNSYFRKKYVSQYICRALIVYIFLESFFTVDLLNVSLFPFFVMAVMVINSHIKSDEISGFVSERSYSET